MHRLHVEVDVEECVLTRKEWCLAVSYSLVALCPFGSSMPRDAPHRRRSGGEARLLVSASSAASTDTAVSVRDDSTDDNATFGLWAGVAVTVNYIIGTGLLGIPAAFAKAGVLLGPLLMLGGAVVMNASKDFILEAMARAEALHKASNIVTLALREARTHPTPLILPADPDYVVAKIKFEITDMFKLFVGRSAVPVYALLLSMYMYGGLVSYTSVWSASWSANVGLPWLNGGATCNIEDGGAGCHSLYTTWLLLFSALAVPLSCMDLEEQLPVQVIMFAARLLVVALFTGTVVAGFGCDGVVFAELAPGGLPPTPLAALSGLPVIIPVAIFAFIFHHSVPGLSQPIANKRSLRRVFAVALVIVTVAYASIGLFIALAFGEGVASQCSLNWRQYVGCMAKPANYTGYGAAGLSAAPACTSASTWADNGTCIDYTARPLYATIISFIVLIFPALDVLSAFPLNAVTLGNNLMSACLGDAALEPPTAAEEREYIATRGRVRGSSDEGDDGVDVDAGTPLAASISARHAASPPKPWYLRTKRGHRLTKVMFRLLAAVPPVVIAAFVTDLGNILQFTGLVGVGIAFTIPALLRIYSLARSRVVFAHVSRMLLPRIGAATVAEVDAAAPMPSVRSAIAVNTGVGVGSKLPSDVTDAEIDAAITEGLALPISLREALTAYPSIDSGMRTPYTAGATRHHGAQAMLFISLIVGAYVLVQTAIDSTKPK